MMIMNSFYLDRSHRRRSSNFEDSLMSKSCFAFIFHDAVNNSIMHFDCYRDTTYIFKFLVGLEGLLLT